MIVIKIPIIITRCSGVGKTSVIEKYLYDKLSKTLPNSHLNYYNIKSEINDTQLILQIWDTSLYDFSLYKITNIIVIVFDLFNIDSLINIKYYCKYIQLHNINNVILVGNKIDKFLSNKKDYIRFNKIIKLVRYFNLLDKNIKIKYFIISALDGINVDRLIEYIILESINIESIKTRKKENNIKNNNIKKKDIRFVVFVEYINNLKYINIVNITKI